MPRTIAAALPLLLAACSLGRAPDTWPPSQAAPPVAEPPAPPSAPAASNPAPAPAASAPAPAPASPPAADKPKLDGTWRSASCGGRKYERTLTFGADGAFRGEDLVSPCPKGVTCVWSGIVVHEGTWAIDGGSIRLTVTKAGQGPKSASFPATLAIDPATGAPAESADGTTCVYQR